MTIVERHLVSLHHPFLATVARLLCATSPTPDDLSDDIVVVPGTRAARALSSHLPLVPTATVRPRFFPAIVTAGDLPKLLLALDPARPLASTMDARLAVLAAIRKAPADVREALSPDGAALRDEPARFALAGEIAKVFRELGSFGRRASDVVAAASALDGYEGVVRWQALAWLEERHAAELDENERTHEPTALALAAAAGRDAYWIPRRVSFVGTADVPPALLALVTATGCARQTFVQADDEHAGRFDEWGTVLAERWEMAEIPIANDRLWFVSGPKEQGEVAARLAASAAGRGVLVGSTDASDEPALAARFGAHGLALRVARGRALVGSLPAAALRAARDLLGAGSVEALSAFVRHPEVDRALGRAGVFFPADKLDRSLSKSPSQAAVTAARVAEPELAAAVEKLLQPLTARDGAREGVPRFLASLFGGAPPVSNDARAMNALVDVARAIGDAPRGLAVHTTPAEHLTLILDALGDAAVPSPADEAAVELLGFLELPLAEADVLLVTGVAEGRLPTRTADDPFLPEPLRRSLGLADAARTFARDAHALLAVVAGHREAHVIVPRTSSAGDALLVSRLVLADHADVVAERLLAAYEPRPPVVLVARGGASTTGFGVPALPPLAERPTTLSVTAFRDYLADPYRFALRHLYRLSVVETDPPELTPSSFGTLVHAVLADFGVSTVKDADDPEAIAAFCAERLDHHLLAMTFGAPTAAARIQTEQARARLLSFAVAQAAHRRSGFRIDRVEQQVETPDALTGITLVGRIDRIDRHEDGRVLLLDYKTHDRAASPEAQHRKRGEWVDLQLPLYRHLARALGYEGEPLLGYASLPRDRAVFSLATWSDEELASADEVAQLVVDKILHDPLPRYPVSPPPAYSEAFAGICRDGTLSDEGDDDGDAAAEGEA